MSPKNKPKTGSKKSPTEPLTASENPSFTAPLDFSDDLHKDRHPLTTGDLGHTAEIDPTLLAPVPAPLPPRSRSHSGRQQASHQSSQYTSSKRNSPRQGSGRGQQRPHRSQTGTIALVLGALCLLVSVVIVLMAPSPQPAPEIAHQTQDNNSNPQPATTPTTTAPSPAIVSSIQPETTLKAPSPAVNNNSKAAPEPPSPAAVEKPKATPQPPSPAVRDAASPVQVSRAPENRPSTGDRAASGSATILIVSVLGKASGENLHNIEHIERIIQARGWKTIRASRKKMVNYLDADLIFLTESIRTANFDSALAIAHQLSTPVIIEELLLTPGFGLSGTDKGEDFGHRVDGTLLIKDNHPLAKRLPNGLAGQRFEDRMYANPNSDSGQVLMQIDGHAVCTTWPRGAILADGRQLAGPRATFSLCTNNSGNEAASDALCELIAWMLEQR